MKKIIYTASLFLIGFALMNNSGGRASSANQGNTGAPGDNSRTCANCHGGPIPVELSIEVFDENDQQVNTYRPGETYRVVVSLDTDSPAANAYGFQMTSIIDENLDDVETWANPSANARLANARDRQYVEHNGPSQEPTFEVEWTAPSEDEGSITFYAAGNAVNLNGSTGGDGSAADQVSLTADVSSFSEEVLDLSLLRISANPVMEGVRYRVPLGDYMIYVYDSSGSLVYNTVQTGNSLEWHLADMALGVNYIRVISDHGVYTDKLIVK